jgi:large conductance mechanosensitive channel
MMKLDPSESARAASSLFDEFKAFAFKGNVIDLAVAVVIGGAFGKVVNSLVNDVIMPLVGVILPGKEGYEGWVVAIRGKPIPYGLFVGELVNFLVVAAAMFVFVVKFVGWLGRFRAEQKASPAPTLTREEELLTEIRDLLRSPGNGTGRA